MIQIEDLRMSLRLLAECQIGRAPLIDLTAEEEPVVGNDAGGEGSLTQWVHCEFVVSFEAICPVITQQVCSEFF